MNVRKPQPRGPRSAGTQIGIPELYQQSITEEQRSTKLDWDKLKLIFAQGWVTRQSLFGPPPTIDESSRVKKEIDLKIHRDFWEAAKYRRIVDLVRRQTTQEDRLLLLARWLCEEKVCELQDIVDIRVLKRLAKRIFGCFSRSDFHHADRVRSWLPYFERLLTDLKTPKLTTAELRKLGYDAEAVGAASRKRSATPAACEWLAGRRDAGSNVDALTLQNAYSRIYGPKRRRAVHNSVKSH